MTNMPMGFFEGTEMPATGWWEALWPDPAGVLAAVGIRSGMDVVDLCCGDGWFTREMSKIARHVIAIDIDPDLLEVARARFADSAPAHGVFVAGDAYDLAALAPGGVDFVFMANAFHGVPDRPRLARAVRATLRPGGVFAIVNWHQRPREETRIFDEPRGPETRLRLPPGMTTTAVEAGGLKLSHLIEIPPFHYGAIFTRPGA